MSSYQAVNLQKKGKPKFNSGLQYILVQVFYEKASTFVIVDHTCLSIENLDILQDNALYMKIKQVTKFI